MFNFLRPAARVPLPSVPEVAAAVAKGEMVLVDVREIAEIRASGKARGALTIPLATLALKADPQAPDAALRPGLPLAVYCASGGRSGMAAQLLGRMGYTPVYNLGGLSDWVAGGGQVDRI